MPKVADVGPYRLFFYSNEGNEPPHGHVARDGRIAKFWLRPAVMEARKLARKEHSEVVLQDALGRIVEYRSYHAAPTGPARKPAVPKGMAERARAPYAARKPRR